MSKRIFRSILLVAAAVLLASLILIMGVLYEYFTALQGRQLSAQMDLAAQGVEESGTDYLRRLHSDECRVTWIAADGTVLYDSQAAPETMENHLQREEVQEALAAGTGESSRNSSTLAERTIYLAQRLSDGTVLRISVRQYTALMLVVGMLQPAILILLAAIVLSAVLADRVSRYIMRPLNAVDLEHPLENDAYEELSPLLTRLERQQRQISLQVGELNRRQNEFAAVTESMREGLVLLNEAGNVLSINPSACEIFQTDGRCLGETFLRVDRSPEITRAMDAARREGHSEVQLLRGERSYQADISRIGPETAPDGMVLLIFDVSNKLQAERSRREFTANVSHELKTPLQSIMGSAELLENDLVKPEDLPRFVGRIRAEAARLVALIEDIIRLSQLDEGGELPREEVDLYALARETVSSLREAAAAAGVSLAVEGEPVCVTGVRRLMQEIVSNLCDNAVKYNRPGGSVCVRVESEGEWARLTVKDTGVGIPAEEQERVFERFYRVDKSHSKAIGGTGLGLSIVKHAAQALGATISLTSQPGIGTQVSVRFPG